MMSSPLFDFLITLWHLRSFLIVVIYFDTVEGALLYPYFKVMREEVNKTG